MQNLIYSDANEAANPTQILDKTMAEAIRAVQIRENAREANGWVDIVAIDEETRHASRIVRLRSTTSTRTYRTCVTRRG